jgi:hypothetical protein
MQQLTDESAQLHAAVESAQGQLANLRADAADTPVPTASPADLRTLLAQAESQLATARQRLAIDEAHTATTPPPVQRTRSASPRPANGAGDD